jgi:hypothetical protein
MSVTFIRIILKKLNLHVVLKNAGPNHSSSATHETSENFLDRGEANALLTQKRIHHKITKWNQDDESKWIQVCQDIVRHSFQGHGGSLGGQVVIDLIVRDPITAVSVF